MSRQSSLGMDAVAAISYMNIQPPCWEKKGNIIECSRRHPEEQLTKDIMSYRRGCMDISQDSSILSQSSASF